MEPRFTEAYAAYADAIARMAETWAGFTVLAETNPVSEDAGRLMITSFQLQAARIRTHALEAQKALPATDDPVYHTLNMALTRVVITAAGAIEEARAFEPGADVETFLAAVHHTQELYGRLGEADGGGPVH